MIFSARFDFKPCFNWRLWRNLLLCDHWVLAWAHWPKMVGFHNLVGVAIASVSKKLALSWKSYYTKVKWHVYSGSYIFFTASDIMEAVRGRFCFYGMNTNSTFGSSHSASFAFQRECQSLYGFIRPLGTPICCEEVL